MAERERAQRLAREDPKLAREIGVGRPDVPDDEPMGVVDVNHASRAAIEALSGVDPSLASRIVSVREHVDGFSSVDDMALLLDLPPQLVEQLRERAVCLPR